MQLQTNFLLTSFISKVFEYIIAFNIIKHFESNGVLYHLQHGFQQNLSCETQLISLFHKLTFNYDQRTQTDLVSMDFAKAFDMIPYKKLFYKLNWYGIYNDVQYWLADFLSHRLWRVVLDGTPSPIYSCKFRCYSRHCPWSHSFSNIIISMTYLR